jgi:DNA-directed RNA polymerase specialized sigma24 family protein
LIEISEKLDSVLAYMAMRGLEGDEKKMVLRLNELGMSKAVIARVTGLTETAVKFRLLRAKKTKIKKVPPKSKKAAGTAKVATVEVAPAVAEIAPE